jgi:hypothetical protein
MIDAGFSRLFQPDPAAVVQRVAEKLMFPVTA